VIAAVLPCWNEPRDRILASVQTALAASDLVIVADDGSREPIDPIEGVEIVRNANAGPAAAMNHGVEAALVLGATRNARLDVGDRFVPDAKLRQLAVDAPALFSLHLDLVEHQVFRPPAGWQRRIYTDGAFCICTCVVSADVWREVGGFDESLRYGDDWDWTMRVQHAVGWTLFDEVTCHAGAFPGGHTKGADADPAKKQLKHECLVRCLETGKRLRRAR
jgi:glycosyltransferase involved in cell wall biosynthesis